jgi:ech hydrogenase subunit E
MPRTVIPFGPQHPVLPEPLHLKLTVEDEIVREVVPAFGFVHRGLEKLAEKRDFRQVVQIVERVCGICSTMHAQCYCQCLEEMMDVEVPPRARILRVVWAELHRIQSHLLWLGLFADSFGFESLFMQCWRIRERVLDINEATGGNRVIPSVNLVGGVRRDIGPDTVRWILGELKSVEDGTRRLEQTLFEDYTVKKRTAGKGVLTGDQAVQLGAVGPVLRGSGVAQDMRLLKYAAYDELHFEPIVEHDGDAWARNRVRYREVLQAIDLIRQATTKLPQGEISVRIKGNPDGEAFCRVEQPRGEVFYYIRANGSKNLERLRIRTPTFANVPSLLAMLPGSELSDVPVIVLSIDPCISCTER